ncbi:MAG: putative methyltransferase [Nitrospira sp.]|nr:putative methyltransferase [Nitrospira sp.]
MTLLDYSHVTEKAGDWVTQEALSMLYTRYRYAAEFCRDKRLLEVACGQAVGLEYLAKQARHTVGGDITEELLARARAYSTKIPLLRLRAEALPLRAASRDVILCYEAIYFVEQPLAFLQECRRILTPRGLLLLCLVNPEWPDFNPSPYSRQYFSARRLSTLLQETGFQTDILGAFPATKSSPRDYLLSCVKRAAVVLRMIPSTMEGKRFLKRLFFGKLLPFPSTIADGMADYRPPLPISLGREVTGYKILYAVCRPA